MKGQLDCLSVHYTRNTLLLIIDYYFIRLSYITKEISLDKLCARKTGPYFKYSLPAKDKCKNAIVLDSSLL
jgi:hypothetical protein